MTGPLEGIRIRGAGLDLPARRWLIAIGLIAFALRALYLWESADNPFRHLLTLDPRVYDAWARRIAEGKLGYEGAFPQAPLYPYFLALCYALLGADPLRALWIQALLGAATAILGAHLAGRLWGRAAGITTGLLLAAYQPGIFYSGALLPPVLAAFLLLLAPALARRPLAAGAACGLAGLAQPLLLPAAWWAALGTARQRQPAGGERPPCPPRPLAALILPLLAGTALVIAPVALHNLARSGELIPISANDGINLFIGNGPRATGYYVPPTGQVSDGDVYGIAQASQLTGRALTAPQASRYWRDRALAAVREQPARAFGLAIRKALAFLQAYEVPQVESLGFERRYSSLLRLPLLPGWLALLALALLGWPLLRSDCAYRALLAAVLASALLGALFFVTGRFRFPLHVYLALAAGAGVSDLRGRILAPGEGAARAGSRRWATALAPALMALVALGPAWLPGSRPQADGEFHFRLGQIADRGGRDAEARREYREALQRAPAHYMAAIRLGILQARAGELGDARALLERGVALDPGNARGLLALGQVHQVGEDLAGACSLYARAWAADTTHLPALESLATAAYLSGDVDRALERARDLVRRAGPGAPLAGRCAYLLARSLERGRLGWALWTTPERAAADLAAAQGDLARAEALWERALESDPQDRAALLELARLARSRGDGGASDWERRFLAAGGPAELLAPVR